MDHKEAEESLSTVMFTELERERLLRLRRAYAEEKLSHLAPEQQRLEFVRWLVTTGRLTDQIP
jgi:hypothetical protein